MNIDIYVVVNKRYHIIIEDKTFTCQHHEQIEKYKSKLFEANKENIVCLDNIVCAYYKIVEQAYEEEKVVNITRNDLIDIFSKYVVETRNNIFKDYYDYLLEIDVAVNAYKNKSISEWGESKGHAYKGFFTHLVKDQIIDVSRGYNWYYVPNQSNGFWGLHWYHITKIELASCKLTKPDIEEIYLQIENNIIAVKITGNGKYTREIRWDLFEHLKKEVLGFKKKTFKQGFWMTVGYIEYDEKNYSDKINEMQNALNTIINGEYTFVRSDE